ncbi:hypothetical protein [Chryseobacterium ginsenosidimutans]
MKSGKIIPVAEPSIPPKPITEISHSFPQVAPAAINIEPFGFC